MGSRALKITLQVTWWFPGMFQTVQKLSKGCYQLKEESMLEANVSMGFLVLPDVRCG